MSRTTQGNAIIAWSLGLISMSFAGLGAEECGAPLISNDRAMLGLGYAVTPEGLSVVHIVPDGPAVAADLRKGDLITAIDGLTAIVRDTAGAIRFMDQFKAGQNLHLDVHRHGTSLTTVLQGRAITCQEATLLANMFRRAESEGRDEICLSGGESGNERQRKGASGTSFSDRMLNGELLLHLEAGSEGTRLRVDSDTPPRGKPLELDDLPSFIQDLAAQLNEGESLSFRASPTAGGDGERTKIELVAAPERIRSHLTGVSQD